MRYRETGNVHKDFHLATDRTIKYILAEYGINFLKELFRRTAQRVYRVIYEALKSGNPEPWVEHMSYFFNREGGVFEIQRNNGNIIFKVTECPAVKHLKERGISPSVDFCLQTSLLNEAWAENTPFTIRTVVVGEGMCYQIIKSREGGKSASQ